jgi:PAS domain S-box-containing protein
LSGRQRYWSSETVISFSTRRGAHGFFFISGYAYLLAAVGSLLFVQLAVGSSLLYRSQAAALLVGAAIPWFCHLVYLSSLIPLASLDLVGVSFSGSGIALLFALSRAKLLEALPAASRLASEFVIEGIDDGVIVTDSRGQVVDLNPSATEILGVGAADAVGKPVEAVLPCCDPQESHDSEVAIETGDTVRYFDIRVSVLKDYHDRAVGRAVVLRDVTERRLHRQRLTVLHRILRHNLRNEMTIICGHTERLDGEKDGSVAAINESATRLVDLSEKAAQIERLADGHNESSPVRLDTSIIDIVQSLRCEFPETEFITPDLPTVRCGSAIETVVRNLVENAALHNTNGDPTVRIEATAEDETVQIAVSDNGPGIPAIEQQTLQRGSETPLRHGSGIGLWLVNWAVGALGGTIEFVEDHPTGSIVMVRLPIVDESNE